MANYGSWGLSGYGGVRLAVEWYGRQGLAVRVSDRLVVVRRRTAKRGPVRQASSGGVDQGLARRGVVCSGVAGTINV